MKEKKFKESFNFYVLLFLCISLGIGAGIGAAAANALDENMRNELFNNISYFLNEDVTSDFDLFYEGLFKYGKSITMLWILGFTGMGLFGIFPIIFAKGASIGFTTAFIIRCMGKKGLLYACCLYLPQNIVLIPLNIIIAFISIKFIRLNKKEKNKSGVKEFDSKDFLFCLTAAWLFIAAVSLMDVFVTPILIGFIQA